LILGSGCLTFGQAGEFDYSGRWRRFSYIILINFYFEAIQAVKVIKEENIYTILINPNIALDQTSIDLSNEISCSPTTDIFVEPVILREHLYGILVSFGEKTALRSAIRLYESKTLGPHICNVLGWEKYFHMLNYYFFDDMNRTPIESIQISEDRFRFTEEMTDIDEKVVPSRSSNPFSRISSESNKTWQGFARVVCSSGRIRRSESDWKDSDNSQQRSDRDYLDPMGSDWA
jgi:carbamoylphosphate synthase large subunit